MAGEDCPGCILEYYSKRIIACLERDAAPLAESHLAVPTDLDSFKCQWMDICLPFTEDNLLFWVVFYDNLGCAQGRRFAFLWPQPLISWLGRIEPLSRQCRWVDRSLGRFGNFYSRFCFRLCTLCCYLLGLTDRFRLHKLNGSGLLFRMDGHFRPAIHCTTSFCLIAGDGHVFAVPRRFNEFCSHPHLVSNIFAGVFGAGFR